MNLVLGYLIYNERSQWRVTDAEVRAIRSVLSKNNIDFYDYSIRDYRPKKQLLVEYRALTDEQIISLFFDSSNVTVTDEFDARIFRQGNKIVEVRRDMVIFYLTEINDYPYAPDDAFTGAICEVFIDLLDSLSPGLNLKRDFLNTTDEYNRGVIEYTTEYKDTRIHSSSVRFYVTLDGIEEIIMSLYDPIDFIGEEREIYSYDEALFRLMFRLKSDHGGYAGERDNIRIQDMKLVYAGDGTSDSFAPYYRFHIRLDPNSPVQPHPYLINAYTNVILN
jgi:hypothetical protein